MMFNKTNYIGIGLVLGGLEFILGTTHNKGSKFYCIGSECNYMGSFFLIVGTIMILSQFTSKKKD